MSRMSEVHMRCVELCVEMEDGSIDMDEATEILSEEYRIPYNIAASYLTSVSEIGIEFANHRS